MKNTIQFTTIATAAMGCVLSSCVYHSNPVPEMPYTPRQQPVVQQPVVQPIAQQNPYAPAGAWAPAVQQPTAPALHPTPPGYTAVLTPATPTVRPAAPVAPVVQQPVAPVTPSTYTPQPSTPKTITQPSVATTAVQPPVVSTVTPPTPAAPASTPTDPKLITNTGPIPVATRVEGDPIRVYNPLDPTKTIRIIDPKTGKVHPSGKVLKVKGTNFKFIVP